MIARLCPERASGMLWSAEEFNAFAPRALTDGEIQRVRAVRGELFHRWSAIAPGQKRELKYSVDNGLVN